METAVVSANFTEGGRNFLQKSCVFIKICLASLLVLTFLVIPTVVEAEGQIYWVSSTAYEWTGDRMASGEWPYYGAAACNFLPIGTRVLVLDGSKAGGVFVVKDRIGRGSDFDIYLGDVNIANQYGRQFIRIQVLEGAAKLDEFRAKNVGVSTWVWIKTLYGAHVK